MVHSEPSHLLPKVIGFWCSTEPGRNLTSGPPPSSRVPPTYLCPPGAVAPPGEQPPGPSSPEQTGHGEAAARGVCAQRRVARWPCQPNGWGGGGGDCLRWRGLKVALPDLAESGSAVGMWVSTSKGEVRLNTRANGIAASPWLRALRCLPLVFQTKAVSLPRT